MCDNWNDYNNDSDCYPEFLESINASFGVMSSHKLFQTDATGLFDAFLNNLPAEARQHYVCRACESFVIHYGGVVTIGPKGSTASVFWNEYIVPDFFVESVKAMREIVLKAKVTGIFISSHQTLGRPITGVWSHMSATLPASQVYRGRLKTSDQERAEKQEEYQMLVRGLEAYPANIVRQAVTLLESETLYRSDKCLGVAKWLLELHASRSSAPSSKAKDNVTWLAVSNAPTGFCHVKSSMIGTLLDDLAEGLDTVTVSRRFAEKMNPANYMRSQVAPTQNNIKQAEIVVEKMGIAESLKRRYATIDEIPEFIWREKKPIVAESNGVFKNLTPRVKSDINTMYLLDSTMTWDKFQRTVLPTAEQIEVKIDNTNRLMGLVTASNKTAPNILQWDNTFSWYYHGGIDGEIKRRVESAGGRYEDNEIRCSLIWEGYTDLDLHCVSSISHIYYGEKKDRYGGYLDIDMNGGCHRDSYPVENIRWATNAPRGRYKFYVHNFSERGKGQTPYIVELNVNGQIYTHNDVALGTDYRKDIFEFDYTPGQQLDLKSSGIRTFVDAWNIPTNEFSKVTGIVTSPNLWGNNNVKHAGTHTFFLLDGCKDISEGKGRGFFTEMLKPEYHGIRQTLEAYTANTPIEGIDGATACGIGYTKDREWDLTVKVTCHGYARLIKIDRWD